MLIFNTLNNSFYFQENCQQIKLNPKERGMIIKSNFNECPICHSFDYEIGPVSTAHNCKCRKCGATWWYNFRNV